MSASPVAFNSSHKKFLKFSRFTQKKIPLKKEIHQHPKGKSNKSFRPKEKHKHSNKKHKNNPIDRWCRPRPARPFFFSPFTHTIPLT
jgi:hypothetical protein